MGRRVALIGDVAYTPTVVAQVRMVRGEVVQTGMSLLKVIGGA